MTCSDQQACHHSIASRDLVRYLAGAANLSWKAQNFSPSNCLTGLCRDMFKMEACLPGHV